MKIYEIISENKSGYLLESDWVVGDVLELDGAANKYTIKNSRSGWYFLGPDGRKASDEVTAKLLSRYPDVQAKVNPTVLANLKNLFPGMFRSAPAIDPLASTTRDLGGGRTPVLPDNIRVGNQNWERASDCNYLNRATREVLPHRELDARIKGAPASAPGAPGAPAPGGSRLNKSAAVGGKALGPIAKAYMVYQGVQELRALPVDQMTRREVTAEVTKIIGRMVADIGVWWVGAGIGGALGGTFGGPAGLVTAIAGGFAADALWGDDVKSIVNTTVNFLMGTKDRPAPSSEQPDQTATTAQTGPNAPPAPSRPGPTQQASDPSLAPQTTPSQTRPSQTPAPNNGGGGANKSWSTIYNLNKGIIGDDPNLIKPGQVLQIPGKGPYTVQPGDTLSKIAARS